MKIKTSKLYLVGVGKSSLFNPKIESYRFAVRGKDFVGYPKYRLVTSGEEIESPSKGRRAVVWCGKRAFWSLNRIRLYLSGWIESFLWQLRDLSTRREQSITA